MLVPLEGDKPPEDEYVYFFLISKLGLEMVVPITVPSLSLRHIPYSFFFPLSQQKKICCFLCASCQTGSGILGPIPCDLDLN